MGLSLIQLQHDIIIGALKKVTNGEWKVLVLDSGSKKLVDNVVKEDDILHENITHIEEIENPRATNSNTDAVYILSPQPHIVECLIADLGRRRYRRSHLLWTTCTCLNRLGNPVSDCIDLDPRLRKRVDSVPRAREQIASFDILSVDYFPRESHLVTFRDPWSFPVLYHPGCNNLVRAHMQDLSRKVLSICVSLGEFPTIRYYRPREAPHAASVLCSHLATFIQDELDAYAQYHPEFPPPASRPRAALYITDRSMDLYSPIVHEFTYQAMAHDLLPIRDDEKVVYKIKPSEEERNQTPKDKEIGENDKIWVDNRHRHMKDTIEKLMGDFKKFLDENPQFADSTGDNATSLNAIRDMLAGLPQFQELKEAYSLHLSMANECMNIFQSHKLADLASVEQSLATGMDEDSRKPKNLAEQVVQLVDDDSIVGPDRLRLIILYLLYRNGLVPADTQKLLAHAQLPPRDNTVIENLAIMGARVQKPLKDNKPAPPSPFGKRPVPAEVGDGYALSRFAPALKSMLEQHIHGTLDPTIFPYTNPPAESPSTHSNANGLVSQASLRSAKPTWAKSRLASVEPRQRIIVIMAGGATYAESRTCYEISQSSSREVFLATSHMLTPGLFLRQVGDLSTDRRRLDLPLDRPPPQAPQHLFEPVPEPKMAPAAAANMAPAPPAKQPSAAATAAALGAMKLGPSGSVASNGGPSHQSSSQPQSSSRPAEKKEKEKEKKKKLHFPFSKK
ncbi:MAG: hypothetical protein M1823_001922 [Watsoniomyces obsoletus]|nr:MAG: hypothetical protein M1823_001922 [Watsoniomyces obsoletus]